MLFIQGKLNKAIRYNAEGRFQETMRLFARYESGQWLSFSSPKSWLYHAQALFLYMEARFLSGHVELVEKELLALFNKLNASGRERYGYNESVNNLGQLIEGSMPLYQNKGSSLQVMNVLGELLERRHIQPEYRIRIQYYMALANIKDDNLVDARAKLAETIQSVETFWTAKVQELKDRIAHNEAVLGASNRADGPLFVEIGHGKTWVGATALSLDGSLCAAMYMDGALHIIRTADGIEIAAFMDNIPLFQEETVTNMGLTFSPDGRFLAVGLGVGIVKVYELVYNSLHAEHRHPGLYWEQLETNDYYQEYTHVTFSASGKYMALVPTAARYDPQGDDGFPIPPYYGAFYVIDLCTGDVLLEHKYAERKIGAISFSADERFIAIGLLGDEVAVWDLHSRSILAERDDFVWIGLADRVGMTQTLAFTSNGDKLVYASRRATIAIIDLTGHEPDRLLPIYEDGKQVVCGLHVDANNRIVAAVLSGHYRGANLICMRISNDGSGAEVEWSEETRVVYDIVVNEEHDELWIVTESTAELRQYGTGEVVRSWNPFAWSYSYHVISSAISVSRQSGHVLIGYRDAVRLGHSMRE